MSELSSEPLESTKHDLYFLESVTFSVDNYLFRVPKYHFSNSSEFFAKTYLPVGDSEESEKPIALADVTNIDFQNFLKILYPLHLSVTLSLGKDAWISVLKLATLWKFDEVRILAISQLDEQLLDATERVYLGNHFIIAEWVVVGLEILVKQPQRVSADTAAKIGEDTAVRLCSLREDHRQSQLTVSGSVLGQVFSEELKALGMGEDGIQGIGAWLQLEDDRQPIGGKKKKKGKK